MQTKYKVLLVGVTVLTAFAFGRYSAPEKIKTVTIEKKTEQKETDANRNKHKETTTTETIAPDGTKTVVTKVVEDTVTDKKTNKNSTDNIDSTTETTKSTERLTVAFLAGMPFSGVSAPVYGASVSKNLIGPITVGLWGLNNATFGASLGLQF